MSDTPSNISDEVYAELRKHFSEEQLMELAANAALEGYRARFNRVFDGAMAFIGKGCISNSIAPHRRNISRICLAGIVLLHSFGENCESISASSSWLNETFGLRCRHP
jgi:hypothetical protein